MLEDVYKSIRAKADQINWKSYNKNDLFFEYIKHENDDLKDTFYAAIMCRLWGYSGKLYSKCNRHIPFEQCYDILIDTINYVLDKRVWENPESSLYNDPTAPDKAFHIVLKRQLGIELARLTADKRQANFNTLSIDGAKEEYNDATEGLFNIVDKYNDMSCEYELVDFIKSQPTKDAIILDQICFNDWSTLGSVVNNLKKLDKDSYPYYKLAYNMPESEYRSAVNNYATSSNTKVLMEVKRTLYNVKKGISK